MTREEWITIRWYRFRNMQRASSLSGRIEDASAACSRATPSMNSIHRAWTSSLMKSFGSSSVTEEGTRGEDDPTGLGTGVALLCRSLLLAVLLLLLLREQAVGVATFAWFPLLL